MTDDSMGLHEYLRTAIASSMFGMVSQRKGLLYGDLFDEDDCPKASAELVIKAIHETGINPDVIAAHVQKALVRLFSEPDNARALVKQHAELLWTILGDPKDGGETPPPIYAKAGLAGLTSFLGLLASVSDD
jgi:hypothetical protein